MPDGLIALDAEIPDPGRFKYAAVVGLLLPSEDGETRLLFIERSVNLRTHAGQIAFPGGKPEPGDADLVETALREANEEVGLPPGGARVIGRLPTVPTPTGYVVMPFVAWAPAGWVPHAASDEVENVITPTISNLADPAIYRVAGRGEWEGRPYVLHEYSVCEPPVWGATAYMVYELLGRMGTRL